MVVIVGACHVCVRLKGDLVEFVNLDKLVFLQLRLNSEVDDMTCWIFCHLDSTHYLSSSALCSSENFPITSSAQCAGVSELITDDN